MKVEGLRSSCMPVQGCVSLWSSCFAFRLCSPAHSPCCVLPNVLEHFCLFLPAEHSNVPRNHNMSTLFVEIEIGLWVVDMVVEREEYRSPKQLTLIWENFGNGCGLEKYLVQS